MKLFTISFLSLIFTLSNSISQINLDWVQRYCGPSDSFDFLYSSAVDNSGNVIVTGYISSSSTHDDFATIKYNSAGVQQWVQIYNGPGNGDDIPYSLAVDGSGNIYVTGSSLGIGTNYDFATIKYNSSGIEQWVQRYNGTGNTSDVPLSLSVEFNGNVYVTGYSSGASPYSNVDYTTIKYNSAGVQQWVQNYNGPGNSYDYSHSLAIDSYGNAYVTGYSYGIGTGADYATIKYNSSGIQQWVQRYNDSASSGDVASLVAVDSSGNVYVTGRIELNGLVEKYVTIKYSSSGTQQWVQSYNAPNVYDLAPLLVGVDNAENVFVVGSTYGTGTGTDYTTIKYNSSGIQQWVQRYNGPISGDDYASSMAIDNMGNIYVTGYSHGSGTGIDYATLKYNPSGIQQWVQRYNGPANDFDEATSINVDSLGKVYVAGYSTGIGTNYDFCTIKYTQLIGLKQISFYVPKEFILSQNYPNPFNPVTKIKFDIPLSRGVPVGRGVLTQLTIHDLLGREVTTLVNEQLKPGSYEVEWDGSNYASGIYFYTLKTDNFSRTKKMILMK
jgi:uncharacterized delta-60 repeat protein